MVLALGFVLLVVLLVLGVPVVFCFGSVIILFSVTFGYTALGLFPTMYGKLASVVLLSIPMFIMAGGVMEKGKIGDALIDFIELFFGKVKGCLAIISVVTCGVFGSICGSGAATLSCIGSIMLPKMRDKKYPMEKAAAIVCCSAPLGLLIPPSAGQIVVAWCGNLSVLACFLSTVIPGIILIILLSIVSYFLMRNDPNIESNDAAQWTSIQSLMKQAGPKTVHAAPALLMPVLILGGIYGGVMTPTEAAGVAVFYAIPVAVFIYKGCSIKELKAVFVSTAATTGVVMVMCALIMVLSQILLMENVPTAVLDMFTAISSNKYVILLMINFFLVFIGMIMDDTCGLMLCTPLLLPIMKELGVSPYQFSAIIGVNLGMGNITPPTAPFLYLSSKIAGVNSASVIKYSLILIVCAYIPTLILTTYVPQVATFLPRLFLGDKFI